MRSRLSLQSTSLNILSSLSPFLSFVALLRTQRRRAGGRAGQGPGRGGKRRCPTLTAHHGPSGAAAIPGRAALPQQRRQRAALRAAPARLQPGRVCTAPSTPRCLHRPGSPGLALTRRSLHRHGGSWARLAEMKCLFLRHQSHASSFA